MTLEARPQKLQHDFARVRGPAVLDQIDALPGAEQRLAVLHWNRERDALLAGGDSIGVVLRSSESPDDLAEPSRAALIAIDFPSFQDVRGYSSARLLRGRLGYEGELRAVGDVMRDQIFLMRRCGIDSFAVKDGKSLEQALAALADFSVTYQAAADEPQPLFRRVPR